MILQSVERDGANKVVYTFERERETYEKVSTTFFDVERFHLFLAYMLQYWVVILNVI